MLLYDLKSDCFQIWLINLYTSLFIEINIHQLSSYHKISQLGPDHKLNFMFQCDSRRLHIIFDVMHRKKQNSTGSEQMSFYWSKWREVKKIYTNKGVGIDWKTTDYCVVFGSMLCHAICWQRYCIVIAGVVFYVYIDCTIYCEFMYWVSLYEL